MTTASGGRGRPPFVVDEEVLLRVREMAKVGLPERDIARCIGLNPTTLPEIKKRHPELADAIKDGRAEGHDELARKLMSLARSGDKVAILFALKCKHGWREDGDVQDAGSGSDRESVAKRVLAKVRRPRE